MVIIGNFCFLVIVTTIAICTAIIRCIIANINNNTGWISNVYLSDGNSVWIELFVYIRQLFTVHPINDFMVFQVCEIV